MNARSADRFDEHEYELLAPVIAAIAQSPEANQLCTALALVDGFELDVAVCPTPREADALLIWLASELPRRRGCEVSFDRIRPDRRSEAKLEPSILTASVLSQLETRRHAAAETTVVVIDATGYRADEHASWRWLFQRWNERRNHIAKIVATPLLLRLPPDLDATFAAEAPDVWSIRSITVRLPAADVAVPRSPHYNSRRFEPAVLERARAAVAAARASRRAKAELHVSGEFQQFDLVLALRRLAEQELAHGHVAEAAEAVSQLVPLRVTVDDSIELAKVDRVDAEVLLALGRSAEALATLRDRVLPIMERHGSSYQRALTYRAFAHALVTAGDLEGALRYLRELAIPLYDQLHDEHGRAEALSAIANVLMIRGNLEAALRICRENIPVYERFGDMRSEAVTQGMIADILFTRGQVDEALRIWRDDVLQVYDRLGDVQGRAVTQAQIADVLFAKGQLNEALNIWKNEALPVFEQLGDAQSKAVTQGRIADALQGLGRLDDALQIQREELLPFFERLGDVRSKAKTQGRIAGILHVRGRFDEAIRILTDEVLPVYERLGDIRSRAMIHGRIAEILKSQGHSSEALRIWKQEVLPVLIDWKM